jgi:hypothetical protein
MNNTEKGKENDTIKPIIHNNKYDSAILNLFSRTKNEKEYKKEKSQTRCVKSIYVEKQLSSLQNYLKTPNSKCLQDRKLYRKIIK